MRDAVVQGLADGVEADEADYRGGRGGQDGLALRGSLDRETARSVGLDEDRAEEGDEGGYRLGSYARELGSALVLRRREDYARAR